MGHSKSSGAREDEKTNRNETLAGGEKLCLRVKCLHTHELRFEK